MSLRTRLTAAYVSFFAAALLALDIGLYLVVRQSLIGSIDNELRLGAQLLQQGFTQSNTSLRGYFEGDTFIVALNKPNVRGFEGTSLLVQVYGQDQENDDWRIIARSPGIQQTFDVPQEQFRSALANEAQVLTNTIGDVSVRELVAPLTLRNPVSKADEVVGVMLLVRRMDETERALNLLFYALLGGGLVVLLAAARGGAWLTRAAFRPIDEIARTAQSIIGADDLSRRVPMPPAEDELQRLTVTVNDLLARLETLFSTQRRFMADVSHELRTPLAAIQGNIEVLSRGAARDPELLADSLADMRCEVGRLIRMTNDLLLLAQSESGLQLRSEPVELDTLLLEVHRELRLLAGDIQIRLGAEDQVLVNGDRDRIKQALLNLGVNAIQHTPPNGSITLGLERRDGFAALTVADTGSGIAPEALPHIFERFYRVDLSRSRNRGGAGLGLSIVQWIAEAHGGQVSVRSEIGVGSSFTLLLPLTSGLDQPAQSMIEQVVA